MVRRLVIFSFLLITACDQTPKSREMRLCSNATEGLPFGDYDQCLKDLEAARLNVWNDALAKYRSKPRPRY